MMNLFPILCGAAFFYMLTCCDEHFMMHSWLALIPVDPLSIRRQEAAAYHVTPLLGFGLRVSCACYCLSFCYYVRCLENSFWKSLSQVALLLPIWALWKHLFATELHGTKSGGKSSNRQRQRVSLERNVSISIPSALQNLILATRINAFVWKIISMFTLKRFSLLYCGNDRFPKVSVVVGIAAGRIAVRPFPFIFKSWWVFKA